MNLLKALTLSLGDLGKPIITSYQLGLIIFKLYKEKKYKGQDINLQKDTAERINYNRYSSLLVDNGILTQRTDLPRNTFSVLGNNRWEAEDIACIIDPFSYISYLSAMSYHGLTDRMPSKIYLCSLDPKAWKINAITKMQKDLKEDFDIYWENGLPRLTKPNFNRIGKADFSTVNQKAIRGYINIPDREIRVSSIGKTFLDCLKKPDLCGGINHVLQTYEEYAPKYLRLILDEIENHGNDIDKVRAGYILDERLEIKNSTIEQWAGLAQRGGSRKLDASAEYMPEWSDKWCLSINILEKSNEKYS